MSPGSEAPRQEAPQSPPPEVTAPGGATAPSQGAEPIEPSVPPGTGAPGDDPAPEVPATEPPTPEQEEEPAPEPEPTAELPAADASGAGEPSDAEAAELIADAIPDALPVEGAVVVVAAEGGSAPIPEGGTAPASAHVPEQRLLATDAGPVVEVPAEVLADAAAGERLVGELELQPAEQRAVAEEVAPDLAAADVPEPAAPTQPAALTEEATAAVTVAALNLGKELTIGGLIIPGSGAGSGTAPRAHTADVAFYTGGGNPTTADLTRLVADAGAYWVGQTGGAVKSFTVGSVKRVTTFARDRVTRCDPAQLQKLWSDAAKQFGRSTSSYIGSARHLIVLVDDACGALAQNSSGWGSYGTLHSGGMSWVDLGSRHKAKLPLSAATGAIAHELGHNLGLAHGKSRVCSGSATDAAMSGGKPVSPCKDVEYGDPFNVMGIGAWAGGRTPPALPAAQRDALGVAAAGTVKAVRASGGWSQTVTLAAAGSKTGVRAIRVEGDRGGTFYIEYRAMTGQDASMGLKAGRAYATGLAAGEHYTAAGVRIVKSDGGSGMNADGTHRLGSTVVSVRDSQLGKSGLFQTARSGRQPGTWNSAVRVSVVSTAATSARVKIDFSPTAKVTRAELAAQMYALAAPKSYTPPKKSPFTDVPTTHPQYRQIAWSYGAGLTPGAAVKGGRAFSPAASVTRESFAVQLYKVRKSKYAGAAKSPFADVKKGSANYKQITWMYASGLAPGAVKSGKRYFAPRDAVTRAAATAAFSKLRS
ncbi:S-layer homology domain-containing protein [Leucobacter chromiireducens]|uniref:S-layer homology domain-containing protein n=1 Tax=Leucobacter chromiireducens TaxID=283877 RepID=UPI000F632A64|nr:S-layer homology domain-containing protein [Leucobacter chromiireducens]